MQEKSKKMIIALPGYGILTGAGEKHRGNFTFENILKSDRSIFLVAIVPANVCNLEEYVHAVKSFFTKGDQIERGRKWLDLCVSEIIGP